MLKNAKLENKVFNLLIKPQVKVDKGIKMKKNVPMVYAKSFNSLDIQVGIYTVGNISADEICAKK